MGLGSFIEPLVVVVLLFGGAWVNRDKRYRIGDRTSRCEGRSRKPSSLPGVTLNLESASDTHEPTHSLLDQRSTSPSLSAEQEPTWRKRQLGISGFTATVRSPNTAVFKDRLLSRVLRKFPFLVEVWYWALIYWVYQLGRAFTAVTIIEGTVHVARRHALQLIHLEKKLRIFHELYVQQYFLSHHLLMTWINRIYSFIHIPGTILFLVWLYHYVTVRNRLDEGQKDKDVGEVSGSPAGPRLYEARRRTMALCNLLAFVVFTAWPCMPPRLLSDPNVRGPMGREARSYGFVDTVHGKGGESSVWTQNRFCNQYAAMPSLHFGYSLLIGLTIMSIPLAPQHRRSRTLSLPFNIRLRLPSPRRLFCVLAGILYPLIIFVAIVSTANHFILDAVAGALVCAIGWWGNGVLLNLLPLEDYFLWCVRIHKPVPTVVEVVEREEPDEQIVGKGIY